MNKLLTISVKTLKEAVRQPKNLAITLGLPVAFMLIFGLAFGSSDAEPYGLAVVDHDESDLARGYVDGLSALEYDDGTPLFDVRVYEDEAAAREALRRGHHEALAIVPAGFQDDTFGVPPSAGSPLPTDDEPGRPPRGTSVTVLGDPSRPAYQTAAQIVAAYTAAFAEEATGQAPPIEAQREAVTANELTQFDFMAPGLMVFAILNMVPQAAAVLARETETRTLDRLRMSPTGSLSLLGGVALANLVLACVSIALMLLTARLMGFHNQGSYAGAYLIALLAAVAVTGIGMIIASFARTQQEATNFGILVAVPGSLLSGAFFAIPAFRIGGQSVYDLLPTSHAVVAMRQVMTLGQPLATVSDALTALAGLSLLFFAAGVMLYRRTRLTAD